MLLRAVATVALALDAVHGSTPYDFTHFEEVLMPQWIAMFRSGAGPGDYSWLPAAQRTTGEGTSVYGVRAASIPTFNWTACTKRQLRIVACLHALPSTRL